MMQIDDKSKCSGCGACAQRCPSDAISMEADAEGFLYPRVNPSACTRCGLCLRTCPILRPEPEKPRTQYAWIAQHRDPEILRQSTSGGAFSAVAENILENGGVVYGAALNENFRVVHRAVRDKADLISLRGSKYAQSDTGDTFREAKRDLETGCPVLYSGTPCQIEGFLRFLGTPGKYPNLLLTDVVCRAVPSPMIWEKYIAHLREKCGDLQACHFRDKRPYGYQMSVLSAWSAERQVYRGHVSCDPYLRAFFSDLSDRPSCYDCKFKKRYRLSDLTLWDCFHPGAFSREAGRLPEKDGMSCALAQSEKGRDAVERAGSLRLFPADPDAVCAVTKEMTRSVSMNAQRDAFFRDAETMDAQTLFRKWLPVRLKRRLAYALRAALAYSGLTVLARTLAKKMIKGKGRM